MTTRRIAPLLALTLLLAASALAADAPKAGDLIPDLALAGPVSREAAAALGLPEGAAAAAVSGIKAKYVLVEVFSMYCPHCQREAPRVNELAALLAASPYAKDIKLVGLGAGNSAYEVDVFRKKYGVAFPLFADPDFAVYNCIGPVGTPFFLLLKVGAPGAALPVAHVQAGPFDKPDAFLATLASKAGLK